ncbi:MAG TPA: GC-type dockerin domain-anchored protein [Phycisphaerales bacterium]|nr:GC-type dockerin domain-anchored protein [Phycisphaerales bacterium]
MHPPTSFARRSSAAIALLLLAAPAHAQLKLGAIGDSLTDEYFEEDYSYAKNWTVLLVQHRGVNMGPTAAAAGVPSGWGEPRRSGYRFNWARYGADSSSAIDDGQHTGLAAQVDTDGVTHAVVAIGANDFSPTTGAYFNIYWGLWSQSQINNYVAGQIADVDAAIAPLDSAGVGLIICNYADFGIAPVTRQFYTNATRRNRVTAAIAQVNAGVLNLARQRRAIHVDLGALGTTLFGINTSLRQFLPIGGINIQLFNRDTVVHGNPLAGFVDDGAHPHTTVQGAFANTLMTALNIEAHAGLPLFTDAEILANAGIAVPPGAGQTLDTVIGPGGYTRFIRNFRCPADLGAQGGLAGPDGLYDNNDFIVFIDAFFVQSATADVGRQGGLAGGDGVLDNNDFVAFIDQFFQGCT